MRRNIGNRVQFITIGLINVLNIFGWGSIQLSCWLLSVPEFLIRSCMHIVTKYTYMYVHVCDWASENKPPSTWLQVYILWWELHYGTTVYCSNVWILFKFVCYSILLRCNTVKYIQSTVYFPNKVHCSQWKYSDSM